MAAFDCSTSASAFFDGILVVAGIDLHQQAAGLHKLIVGDGNVGDGADHLRTHVHIPSVDERIVREFVIAGMQPPHEASPHQNGHDHSASQSGIRVAAQQTMGTLFRGRALFGFFQGSRISGWTGLCSFCQRRVIWARRTRFPVICRDQVLRRPTGFGPFDHLRTHRDELGPSPAAHVGPYYSMSFMIGTKIIGILRARPAVIRRPVLKWPPTGRPQGGMWVSRISPRSSRRRKIIDRCDT